MTAPAVLPAPSTPTPAPFDIKDALASAVEAALPAPTPDPVEATDLEEEPTDDSVSPASSPDEAPSDADVPAEGDDAADTDTTDDDQALALPDGYVAVPVVSDGLATEFALYDDEGEVEVPALMVEYKANGKVRKDRLDQVVKLAQWGVYNQERQEKIQQEVAAKEQEYAALIAEREQQMERLLTDEDFLEAVRESYLQENSPERRAERAERRVQDIQLQHQMQAIEQQGDQFLTTELAPALTLLTAALPTVTAEELESRVLMAMQAHAEVAPNGVTYVPPSRYDAIRQYILDDLSVWAQAQHARRSQSVPTKPQAKAQAELERAQVEAQKAKRAVGQATKPVGTPAKDAPKAKAAKPATIDDAVHSALSEVLSSMR